jgi:hypothetical protein
MCKTGFARRALTGKGMRCARSVEGVDLYERWSIALACEGQERTGRALKEIGPEKRSPSNQYSPQLAHE